MLYLLWDLLNSCLFLFFVFVCFKATRLVRDRIGIIAAIVFAFGLISFVGSSNSERNNFHSNTNLVDTWNYISPDSVEMGSHKVAEISLEKTVFSKYNLNIQYAKDKDNKSIVYTKAYTFSSGSEIGVGWRPIVINVFRTDEYGIFKYNVVSTVQWKLLGSTFYHQAKSWSGTILLE